MAKSARNRSMPRIVIVGGGLAGLTVAKELLQRGLAVTVVEKSQRLGGKAGADERGGTRVDHGFHIFPAWYRNTRALLRDLNLERHLIDVDTFYQLPKGAFPRFVEFRNVSTLRNLWHDVFRGILPWPQSLLSFYFLIDLTSQPFSYRGYLDRISTNGFLWSRFYATERIAVLHQQTILQTSAVPNYVVSAMTMRNVFRYGLTTPKPIFSMLDGDLQQVFVEPYRRLLEGLGADIQLGREVSALEMKENRVAALRFPDGSRLEADLFVLATPVEVTRGFVDDDLYAAEDAVADSDDAPKRLSDLMHIETAQMAALEVQFARRIPHLPRNHVTLFESRYGISFIDISQHWPELRDEPYTRLSLISSNFEPLQRLDEGDQAEHLVAELREFVPEIQPGDVDWKRTHMVPNLNAQLFLSSVGAWHFRPTARTRVANLFVAGDYCRTQADLATMESAVSSGLNTAAELLSAAGLGGSGGAQKLAEPPWWLLLLLKWAGLPLIFPIGAYYWLERRLREWREEVSS